MSGCLGDVVAALVDGELDHAARERAQRHLAHCDACRAEVDAQRRLKARLHQVPAPDVPDALTARLLAMTAPDVATLAAGPARPVSVRPAARPVGRTRPAGRPSRRRRRAAAGSALAALGVAAALALGGQPPQRPSTPVDPGTDAFVAEFVDTTGGGTTAPDVTSASLTTGGARSAR